MLSVDGSRSKVSKTIPLEALRRVKRSQIMYKSNLSVVGIIFHCFTSVMN